MLRVATTRQVGRQGSGVGRIGRDGTLGRKGGTRRLGLCMDWVVGKVSLAVPMRLSCVSREFRDGDFVW
jgi:hypothetical protein